MPYMPQERSLAYAMCAFFARCEDECLTSSDVAVKFGRHPGSGDILTRAIEAGYVRHEHGGPGKQDKPAMYYAGPKIAIFAREAGI